MNKTEYVAYLLSDHWLRTKDLYAKTYKYECYLCGARNSLDLHHATYENIGDEKLTDLVYLCRECHSLVHSKTKDGYDAKEWINTAQRPAAPSKERDFLYGDRLTKSSPEGILRGTKNHRKYARKKKA